MVFQFLKVIKKEQKHQSEWTKLNIKRKFDPRAKDIVK